MNPLIVVLGPTASGKTSFAVNLAYDLETEIISGDSRQVYQSMDIGTGKDLSEYELNQVKIPYHLIDILPAGEQYHLFAYKQDFLTAYNNIRERNKLPILCGGTGLYIEAVLNDYRLQEVPPNSSLREKLKNKTQEELKEILTSYGPLHNKSDLDTAKRTIRAIEIADCQRKNTVESSSHAINFTYQIIGMQLSREERRERISKRLQERLQNGMIEEVESLLAKGISAESLIYYGLEYKFITNYLQGDLSYTEMYQTLETAIHRFSKRQMTWFRRMERRGFNISWIEANLPMEEKIKKAKNILKINRLL